MSMYWESIPDIIGVGIGSDKTKFIVRNVGFSRAVAAIDKALAAIAANPISASFITDLPYPQVLM